MPDINSLFKSCLTCHGVTNKKCANCDAAYCSFFCRNADKRHPTLCAGGVYEIKVLETDINANIPMADVFEIVAEPIKSNSLVNITYVLNQRTVFVRMMNEKADYIQFSNDTIKLSKKANILKVLPKVGSLVLAMLDGLHHRALVLRATDDTDIRVAFIDCGNVEKVTLDKLKEIPVKLKQRKRFVTKVVLEGVSELGLSDEPLLYLNELMVKDIDILIRFNGDFYDPSTMECQLVEEETNDFVNAKILTFDDPNVIIYGDDFYSLEQVCFIMLFVTVENCIDFIFFCRQLKK